MTQSDLHISYTSSCYSFQFIHYDTSNSDKLFATFIMEVGGKIISMGHCLSNQINAALPSKAVKWSYNCSSLHLCLRGSNVHHHMPVKTHTTRLELITW